jgi:hypothetical protein
VSWGAVLGLCAGAYVLKAAGVLLATRVDEDAAERWGLELLVVPVLAALIVTQTIGTRSELVLDARLPAVLIAAVLVWRRAPFLVVVLAAGATAALLRLL